MPESRLYKVVAKDGNQPKHRLIQAATRGQVNAHLIESMFTIEPATPMDVAELYAANGGKMDIEKAKAAE